MNRFFKKGQSLVELAVFASVIFMALGALVSYALNFNQYQRIMMRAAQRAAILAKEVADTSLSATVVLMYDRAIPDISSTLGMFGVSKKRTLYMQHSFMRTNNLYGQIEYNKKEDLPQVIYDVNGKVYRFSSSGFKESNFKYNLLKLRRADGKNVELKQYLDSKGNPFKKKEWRDNWWRVPGFSDSKTQDPPLAWKWVYCAEDADAQVTSNSMWDVDGDNEEENIIGITANFSTDPITGKKIKLNEDTIQYIDNDLGIMDNSETTPVELRSGFLSQYYEEAENINTLLTEQKEDAFYTVTYKIKNQQIIERYFRLNWRLEVGSVGFNELTRQIQNNNPNCSYSGGFFCSDNLASHCDCIGTKEYVVNRLLPLYPKEPFNVQEEVKKGSFYYEDIVLDSGEVVEDAILYVNALTKDEDKKISKRINLVSGKYFLAFRSKYEQDSSVPEKAYEWSR